MHSLVCKEHQSYFLMMQNYEYFVIRSTYTQVEVEKHKGFYLAIQHTVTCESSCVGILIPPLGKLWIFVAVAYNFIKDFDTRKRDFVLKYTKTEH